MNRLDLIIEAIRLAEYHVIAKDWGDDIDLELYKEALAAARELKELYPQGAKVRPAEFIAAASIGVGADFVGTPMMWAEWPTRFDEVKHD